MRPSSPTFRSLVPAAHCLPLTVVLLLTAHCSLLTASAQSVSATLSGTVEDQNGAVVPSATVTAENKATGLKRQATTNGEGQFTIPLLPPSIYTVTAQAQGFSPVQISNVVLNVGDQKSLQIPLRTGNISEMVQVSGDAPLINESPAVGTVVDRQFVSNIPLNARSLQPLITLVPGVVLAPGQRGQLSVNGQRANANYFTIDGVSANIGMNTSTGGTGEDYAGTQQGVTTFGGTNNLISIDALQEFRIQTSTFAAEYGRTPGGQISLLSRSGTNQFRGAIFEYFRNDVLDANDWFSNRAGLKRAALRQNQCGGVLGGPIKKNRTFFFFSYEDLRLLQPQTLTNTVPALRLRQNAPAAVKMILNSFPVPTGSEILAANGTPTGQAPFTGVYSAPINSRATSLRLDHIFGPRLVVFGRYNQAHSKTLQRSSFNLADVSRTENDTRTLTLGATVSLTSQLQNDLRVNYSRTLTPNATELDNFGGAVPFSVSDVVTSSAAITSPGAFVQVDLFGTVMSAVATQDFFSNNLQRQFNLANNISYVKGAHQLKFGIDYRRLAPQAEPRNYALSVRFNDANAILNGTISSGSVIAASETNPVFTNFSAYGQDIWKVNPRLSLTFGLRWEVNPAPKDADGRQPYVVNGVENLPTATLSLGGPLWKTQSNNFAPRFGIAYQLSRRSGWERMVRGGIGVFFDMGTGQGANAFTASPFSVTKALTSSPYPLTTAQVAPPPLQPPVATTVYAFDPDLRLPRTYQWNLTLEQGLGSSQSLTASYVGAIGRRLLERRAHVRPIPTITSLNTLFIITSDGTSDYHAMQIQFQRRLARGLQARVSYTWSHAIDDVSAESDLDFQILRGDSNFDIRHNFSSALTYNIPKPRGRFVEMVFSNWAVDTIIRAQTAYPFTPQAGTLTLPDGRQAFRRPNLVPGMPLYLVDRNAPGGIRVNPAAFQIPSVAGTQGNVGRNILRGFPSHQVDLALRRSFPLKEQVKLVFRAEAFNLFNHPNFGLPTRSLTSALFGQTTTMLNRAFGTGSLSPLYQVGGARSMQFAIRVEF